MGIERYFGVSLLDECVGASGKRVENGITTVALASLFCCTDALGTLMHIKHVYLGKHTHINTHFTSLVT